MIDDLTRSVVKAHQWLKDNPKEQGKPTQEQIDEIVGKIDYMEECPETGMAVKRAELYVLATALREAQSEVSRIQNFFDAEVQLRREWKVRAEKAEAEVARLRGIVDADTATLNNARKCISVGGTIYQRPRSPNCAGPTFYTPFEREVLAAIDMTLKLREGE